LSLRVVIAEDEAIIRMDLRETLEEEGYVVVGETGRGDQAVELVRDLQPDLAILDVKMPKLTGLQATREIRRQAPEVAVLILSMHDDERYLFEALKAGASGYVLKTQADTDLLAAIRAVERGEPFLTPAAQRTRATTRPDGTSIVTSTSPSAGAATRPDSTAHAPSAIVPWPHAVE